MKEQVVKCDLCGREADVDDFELIYSGHIDMAWVNVGGDPQDDNLFYAPIDLCLRCLRKAIKGLRS